MNEQDFDDLLAAHEYAIGHRSGSICLCGFVPMVNPETLTTQQDYHRAHVASALSGLVAAWIKGHRDEADYYGATEARDALSALVANETTGDVA